LYQPQLTTQANARCERFMRTLKEEEIDCREYRTVAELERNMEGFI